jgi:hypothetical protein
MPIISPALDLSRSFFSILTLPSQQIIKERYSNNSSMAYFPTTSAYPYLLLPIMHI